MDASQRTLYHQIHPAKLGTDLLAEFVSIPLFWKHQLRAGLMTHLIPPVVATAFVPAGPPTLSGDVVTVIGAWQRRPFVIVIGSLLVIAGWTVGPSPSEPSHRASPPHVR